MHSIHTCFSYVMHFPLILRREGKVGLNVDICGARTMTSLRVRRGIIHSPRLKNIHSLIRYLLPTNGRRGNKSSLTKYNARFICEYIHQRFRIGYTSMVELCRLLSILDRLFGIVFDEDQRRLRRHPWGKYIVGDPSQMTSAKMSHLWTPSPCPQIQVTVCSPSPSLWRSYVNIHIKYLSAPILDTSPVAFGAGQSYGALGYGAALVVPREHLELWLLPEDFPEARRGLRRKHINISSNWIITGMG